MRKPLRLLCILSLFVLPVTIGCGAATHVAPSQPTLPSPVIERSGSAFIDTQVNGQWTYAIKVYNQQKAQIDSELQTVYASGQRGIAVYIWFSQGTLPALITSPTGLSSQDYTNLQGFLESAKRVGFTSFLVDFAPYGENNPFGWHQGWTPWTESMFQENWTTIEQVTKLLNSMDLNYITDLSNESLPNPIRSQLFGVPESVIFEYDQRLWNLYADEFGTSRTAGFDIGGSCVGNPVCSSPSGPTKVAIYRRH